MKQGVEQEEALKENRLRPLRDKLLGSARRFYDRLNALLEGQPDAASKRVLAESYAELGKLIDRIGQKPEAMEAYRKAVAISRELAATPGAGASERVELAQALNEQGSGAHQLGDRAGSLAAYEEAAGAGRAAGRRPGGDGRGPPGPQHRPSRGRTGPPGDRRRRSGAGGLPAGPRRSRGPRPRTRHPSPTTGSSSPRASSASASCSSGPATWPGRWPGSGRPGTWCGR